MVIETPGTVSDDAQKRARTALTRALWNAENIGNIPKDPQERKEALRKARPEFAPKVTHMLKILDESGLAITEKPE